MFSLLQLPLGSSSCWWQKYKLAQHPEGSLTISMTFLRASQVVLVVKNLPANAGDVRNAGLTPELGRSGGGHGNPLQYSCLENPMDRTPGGLQFTGSQRVGHNWSNITRTCSMTFLNIQTLWPSTSLWWNPPTCSQTQSCYTIVSKRLEITGMPINKQVSC